MKRALVILAVLAAVAAGAAAVAYSAYERWVTTPLEIPAEGLVYEVPPGAPFAAIAADLEDRGIVRNGALLRWYARLTGQAARVQAGEYRLRAGTSPPALLDQFTSGEVLLYSFTIVEGWNHRELLAGLQAHPQVRAEMQPTDWPALLAALGAETDFPEGLFLPETYHFPRGTSDREVLGQAFRLMRDTLAAEWAARSESTPVRTPYEALILASIIEKETALPAERQEIAGVFARRLDRNMRLQTDPTVIYGLGAGFNGNITRRDLQTDTPYNTYTRHGLPPTPIAMPGRPAIHAALHPAEGETLYFVATGLGDGSHAFSVTAEEHEAAVQAYLQRLRQNR